MTMTTIIQDKDKTDEETKQYHLRKLLELSIQSIGEIPQLDEPDQDQKQWVLRRLKQSSKTWESIK